MLTQFQQEILRVISANRSPENFVAGGSALNRHFPRLSSDIDLFSKTVSLIDRAFDADRATLEQAGYHLERVRETTTLREWIVSLHGRSTKLQWSRDTSWLFFPPVPDADFGYVLSFEDLAVNKLNAAADRGRLRDFHDLTALDQAGARLWVLALASMGKDGEISPEGRLERCLRLLPQAGKDDEDPDYAGPPRPWSEIRSYLDRRLREDLQIIRDIPIDWVGRLALDKTTKRLAMHLDPQALGQCVKHGASQHGVWPTSPSISSDMLRAVHPEIGKADR